MSQQLKFSYNITGVVNLEGMVDGTARIVLHTHLNDLTRIITENGLITGDSEMTVDSYSATVSVGKDLAPVYPVSHGTQIIQFGDETFVWYDEAGLQGGVEYSLKQAEAALKRYSASLDAPKLNPDDFAPITQPGYGPGEIPHHYGDLEDFASKLLKQNEAMRDVMARAGMQVVLAKVRKDMEAKSD